MHARDREVMVIVLQVGNALRHGAIVVVVHIAQMRNAMLAFVLTQSFLRMPAANQISNGLRPRGIAILFGKLVQNGGQFGFK